MSVDEYLHTSFRPDVDYVDGFIEERNLGEFDHARLQGILLRLLSNDEDTWQVYAVPECRVQVKATRFRVPDICLVDARLPVEQIIRRPPLLCVEVVSPEDRLPRLLERARDFHEMGVATIWVFDPETRKVWVSQAGRVIEWQGGVLEVAGTPIQLDPEKAFAKMIRKA
jgi:Uma2 family endonuclease